ACIQPKPTSAPPRGVGGPRLLERAPGGAEQRARERQRAGREHGRRAERALEREQHHGGQRRPEEAAQRVVLHAAAPNLRADAPDEPVERRAGRHRTNGSRACAVLASTLSTIWPRSVSTSMPSASPSKFRITRCRSAGATSALRS